MKNNQSNSDLVQVKEPTEEVLNSLYATIFLEHSVFTGNKRAIEEEIELSLEQKDEDAFMKLTERYKEFMASYEKGLTITEQGFEFLVFFCKKNHDLH
jgi:uncharacterized protein YpiB (UPF0302 family)